MYSPRSTSRFSRSNLQHSPTPSKLRLGIYSLILSASPLNGAVLLTEDFESLTTGELNGQSGTGGISGTWSAQEGITEIISAPTPFSTTLADGEIVFGGGKTLQLTGNSNEAISANLTSPQTATFYVSFLIQLQAGSIGVNDFATIWLGEGNFIGAPAVGIKSQLGPNNTDFMGRISGNQEGYAPEQLVVGDSYFLVAEVLKTGGSSTYNEVNFWVNPGVADQTTPEATSTGSIDFDEFSGFGIRSVNLDADDVILIDNLTISTTWIDAFVPNGVPEPSSSLLVGVASIISIFRRKRPQ